MATQKQAEEIRGIFGKKVEELKIEGFSYEGRTKEGFAFANENDVVILKAIVKNENFDLAEALEEYQESQTKKVEREKKHAEKVEKAKQKKKENQ